MPLPEKQLPLFPPASPRFPVGPGIYRAPTLPSPLRPPSPHDDGLPRERKRCAGTLKLPGRQGHVAFEAGLPVGHVGCGLVAGVPVSPGALGLGKELEGEERTRVAAAAVGDLCNLRDRVLVSCTGRQILHHFLPLSYPGSP